MRLRGVIDSAHLKHRADNVSAEAELRDLIAIEVSTGNTMRVLNQAISSGELTTAVQAIASALGSQVARATPTRPTVFSLTAASLSSSHVSTQPNSC